MNRVALSVMLAQTTLFYSLLSVLVVGVVVMVGLIAWFAMDVRRDRRLGDLDRKNELRDFDQ